MKPNSFGKKLWLYFLLFAALILGALWLLQTVFLQSLYDGMAINGTRRLAKKIAAQIDSEDFEERLDDWASEGSVLIFLTDQEGNILYSTDEHSSVYQKKPEHEEGRQEDEKEDEKEDQQDSKSRARHDLPAKYHKFLERLKESPAGQVDYTTGSGSAYIYGQLLERASGSEPVVLYMSAPLGGAGAAVDILRMQLLWVTLASLALATVLAWLIARQFARPVAAITYQARCLPGGDPRVPYEPGFCRELDEVSLALKDTAGTLRRLENARRELLANVSHDLRTPLTMIKGYAELVREISWSDEEKREQDLGVIIRETDRLTALVNDILEYSAAQSAGQKAELGPLDLSRLIGGVLEQFAPLARQRDCEITGDVPPGLRVQADGKYMGRVLYNLLDNGLRYAKERLVVTAKVRSGMAHVEVKDDGPGIPPEELPLVWERYFTSKQRGGRGSSGLGLAITKELLSAQKARFGVNSQVGGGTAFWFEVPLTK